MWIVNFYIIYWHGVSIISQFLVIVSRLLWMEIISVPILSQPKSRIFEWNIRPIFFPGTRPLPESEWDRLERKTKRVWRQKREIDSLSVQRTKSLMIFLPFLSIRSLESSKKKEFDRIVPKIKGTSVKEIRDGKFFFSSVWLLHFRNYVQLM